MEYLNLAYVLIALGVLFILAEVMISTGFVSLSIGVLLVLIGVGLIFLAGETRTGVLTLVGVAVGIPVLLYGFFYLSPGGLFAKRLIPYQDEGANATALLTKNKLEELRGRVGKTISPLRPAGVAEFDSKRIDCMTEGMMVDAGEWVRCVDVRAGRVIVRRVDKARLEDFENSDFG